MAEVYGNRNLEKYLSRMPGVVGEVQAVAEELAQVARGELAKHRDTGAASIEVKLGHPDSIVSLVDEAALSIEFGHGSYDTKDGRHVGASEGLHIMGRLL